MRNAEAGELFLQDPSPDLDEIRAILADIRKDDRRAGAVIDRMRSQLKRREVEHNLLDLNLLAREVIDLACPEADARKVRIAFNPVSSLPPVRGDRVQLQQVLLNLLLNAMDAMNDSAPDDRRMTVLVQAADTQVEVSVSDAGHGIPADKLPHVFEPFFSTKPNGLGMGLAISRSIIEAHRGSIRANNNEAAGATFTIILPAAEGGNAK
jgi:signal transduction histidine kinase